MALLLVFVLASCQNANNDVRDDARAQIEAAAKAAATSMGATPAPDLPKTTMEFEEKTFDFGTITEGEMVSHTYSFTNTGENPLVLNGARGSCGCTVPSWPREPIGPGESADITVEFNSKNKVGKRNQTVTITANTEPNQTIINLTGEVVAPSAGPQVTQ